MKRKNSHAKRLTIFSESFLFIVQSFVCQILFLQIIIVLLSAFYNWWYLLVIPLIFLVIKWKQFVFELLVIDHFVEWKLGLFRWFEVVDENLLLGAIPLHEQHYKELIDLGVKAVISVVEPFELQTITALGRPVDGDDWEKVGIDHVILPSPDFLPPSYSTLEAGAKILDKYLTNNQRVYIHCKSGRGRSASVVLMYFYLCKNLDMLSVFDILKGKRSVIFSQSSKQMKHLLAYEQERKSHRRGNL